MGKSHLPATSQFACKLVPFTSSSTRNNISLAAAFCWMLLSSSLLSAFHHAQANPPTHWTWLNISHPLKSNQFKALHLAECKLLPGVQLKNTILRQSEGFSNSAGLELQHSRSFCLFQPCAALDGLGSSDFKRPKANPATWRFSPALKSHDVRMPNAPEKAQPLLDRLGGGVNTYSWMPETQTFKTKK